MKDDRITIKRDCRTFWLESRYGSAPGLVTSFDRLIKEAPGVRQLIRKVENII